MLKPLLTRIDAWLNRLSPEGVHLVVLVTVAVIAALDYFIGYEATTSFFYLIPIFLATWYRSARLGYLVTIAGILLWTWTNAATGEVYSNAFIPVWNAAVRIFTFSLFVYLLQELKLAYHSERALARTDHLTGIFNSREFYEQLELELKRADRLVYPISLAFIDLDNFKRVNDELGHIEGDAQLRKVTAAVSGAIRKTDLFARLGGDEFALFLPNVDQANAKQVMQKIESSVAAEMQAIGSPITLSVGVITFSRPPESVIELLRKADALMYQAKTLGKNRALYFEVG